jgi:hypothetical protein
MPTTSRLLVAPLPRRQLEPWQQERMWQLYVAHYDHVDRATFDRDLAEKTVVFLGTDAVSGAIVGFSTGLFFSHVHEGRTAGLYFSGDTIFDPHYWGQTALQRAVVGSMVRWQLRHPGTPLYWHLICSGVRTYLTLVRNFPTHWPHHEHEMPAWERGLLDAVARRRYGEAWRAERGVVSFGAEQPVLKAGLAPITPGLLELPEIAYFVRANPGHLAGDELAMLARVDLAAVSLMSAKWIRKALGRRAPAGAATPGTARPVRLASPEGT